MTIETIALDDEATLQFELEVTGTNTQNADDVRAVLSKKDSKIQILLDGHISQTSEKLEVEVKVPKLINILEAGEYDFRLEVIVDGRFFKPLQDKITFTAPAKTEAVFTEAKLAQRSVVARPKKVEVDLNAVPEGCSLVKVEGLDIVKNKNGLYIGVRLREGIKWASKAHATLTKLIEDVA